MFKMRITLAAFLVIILVLLAGCVHSKNASLGKSSKYKPQSFLYQLKKPKVIQLSASDCPWDKSFSIKNKDAPKVYGDRYARKQNKKLKKAL